MSNAYLSLATILLVISISNTGSSDIDNVFEESRFRESVTTTISENSIIANHKYYVSVSNAEYKASAGAVQMISRFFIDDLEDVLNVRYENNFVLGEPGGIDKLLPTLQDYLNQKLDVAIDGEGKNPTLIGAEYQDDQLLLYIELPAPKEPSSISISYTALIELFPEQKNLIHFNIAKQRKTVIIDANRTSDTLKF